MRSSDFDAFLSYSHALDNQLAPGLQSGIERFAKPWYRVRALRVFRDVTTLSAAPELWHAIEKALSRSRWFILLASPESAASKWVDREVAWWLANRSSDRLLIVLTNGDLRWNDAEGRPEADVLPPSLRDALRGEPLWVDVRWLRDSTQVDESHPRFRDCVADIAAAVRGVDKDLLVGEHLRQHRRTMRLARAAMSVLLVLTVTTLVAALIALTQRDNARTQARVATARQVAATALANVGSRIDVAQLLAVEAFRMDDNPQTRAALFQATTSSPHLVRYFHADQKITAITTSGDGRTVAAGTAGGKVLMWHLPDGKPREFSPGSRAVSSVALNADGSMLAAASGEQGLVWDVAADTPPLVTGPATLVALSPEGRWAGTVRDSTLVLFDRTSGQEVARTSDVSATDLAFTDESAIIATTGSGEWQRLSAPSGRLISRSIRPHAPMTGFAAGSSTNGEFYGLATLDVLEVWRTSAADDVDAEPFATASLPVRSPNAVAVSRNGRRVAAADSGTLHVKATRVAQNDDYASLRLPVAMTGNDDISAVRFLDDDHLVSATGDRLALWDLSQPARWAAPFGPELAPRCSACGPPAVSISPDGTRLVVRSEDQVITATVRDVSNPVVLLRESTGARALQPMWSPDGTRLYLAGASGTGIEVWDSDRHVLLDRWPTAGVDHFLAVGITPDGGRIVAVDAEGTIEVITTADGRTERTVPGRGSVISAAVSLDGATVTIREYDGPGREIDALTGSERTPPGTAAQDDPPAATTADGRLTLHLNEAGTAELRDRNSGPVGTFTVPAPWRDIVADLRRSTGAAFTPDGSVLITATSAGRPIRWPLDVQEWRRSACIAAGRDLSSDEWRRLIGTNPPTDLGCER
ncbi:hypothetical protein ACWGE0_25240 [Lentzea sp. NPDC054927]